MRTTRDGKPIKEPRPHRAVDDELADRLLLPLINEAVACLHEGVVADADLLDAGVIFGAGFAPFTGGPIRYARAARYRRRRRRGSTRFARAFWDALHTSRRLAEASSTRRETVGTGRSRTPVLDFRPLIAFLAYVRSRN